MRKINKSLAKTSSLVKTSKLHNFGFNFCEFNEKINYLKKNSFSFLVVYYSVTTYKNFDFKIIKLFLNDFKIIEILKKIKILIFPQCKGLDVFK
ncbi:hypothetical protein BpHYR1_051217 [Brachionus plicatilis]|uniref:Uncharacterized protein n=1 Tax=Brachionus plicatilis TaxID=10195 RepID=A0A3M7SXJ8_BRAPC|nr:hypothetical protein BpHYR1_051217 [Brachionus plicatilis]